MMHAMCRLEYVHTQCHSCVPSPPLGQFQYIYAIAYLIFIANLNDGTNMCKVLKKAEKKIDSAQVHTHTHTSLCQKATI